MSWITAIHRKRHQWVHAMVQARRQGKYHREQALIGIIAQLGEFESEFQERVDAGVAEENIVEELTHTMRKTMPELWAHMALDLHANDPHAWIERPLFTIWTVAGYVAALEGREQVGFENRMNQLDALPNPQKNELFLEGMVDAWWLDVCTAITTMKANNEQWKCAAYLHAFSKQLHTLYCKVQNDAIDAVQKAEESGELMHLLQNDID